MTFAPVAFFAASDLVVIDQNPEMADMDNPRGDVYGTAAKVVAENEAGDRRSVVVAVARWAEEVEPRAERQAAALNLRLASGRLPVGFDSWAAERPAYGSDAYIAHGADDDIAWERDQD